MFDFFWPITLVHRLNDSLDSIDLFEKFGQIRTTFDTQYQTKSGHIGHVGPLYWLLLSEYLHFHLTYQCFILCTDKILLVQSTKEIIPIRNGLLGKCHENSLQQFYIFILFIRSRRTEH